MAEAGMTYYVHWRNYEYEHVDYGSAGPFSIEEATFLRALFRHEDAQCGFCADYWLEPA